MQKTKTKKIEIIISDDPVVAYKEALAAQERLDEAKLQILQAAVKEGHNPGSFAKATGTNTGVLRRAMRNAGVWAGERRPRQAKSEAQPKVQASTKKAKKEDTPRLKDAKATAAARKGSKSIVIPVRRATKRAGR